MIMSMYFPIDTGGPLELGDIEVRLCTRLL